MNVQITVGPVIALTSGLLLVALAALLLSVRPQIRVATRFGWFAAFFGMRFVLVNVDGMIVDAPGLLRALLGVAAGVVFVVAATFLAAFSLAFPSPIPRADRRKLLLPPLLLGAGSFFYWFIGFDFYRVVEAGLAGGSSKAIMAAVVANFVGYAAVLASLWGAVLLYALRYRATSDLGERRQYALVAAALVIWPAFENAYHGPTRPDGVYWFGTGVLVLLAGVWLANTGLLGGRTARSVAFVALGAGLAGAAYGLLPAVSSPRESGVGLGLSRVVGVAILAYAILRHQVLGLDVRIRWGISKTTLAAVFIAVFFVASEAAQEFFGATLGSSYVGILAAGLLVFAIAPLSRFADRVAERAVPVDGDGVSPVGSVGSDEAAFLEAVRLALRDQRLTREEERVLLRLAERLQIPPSRAMELVDAAEQQRRSTRNAGIVHGPQEEAR